MLVKVEFAPWLRLQHSPARLREGDTAVFRCRAQANPDKVGFSKRKTNKFEYILFIYLLAIWSLCVSFAMYIRDGFN